uniref:hypothetical protein n=1 Tax=Ciborinia camelliae TaxID=647257 RepID=UPI001FA6C0EA
ERPRAMFTVESKAFHHLIYMMTSSDLGLGESPRPNLAYPLEANKKVIHVSFKTRDVVPMVKVILLESYPLVTSGKGLVHAWSWYYGLINYKSIQWLIDYNARRAVRNSYKSESGGPKGTIVVNMERGDCLSVGASPTYGNGASVVGLLPKGGRKWRIESNSQHNGFRCYSKAVMKTAKGDLPRRFEKLTQMCAAHKDGFKANDIYKLMFNVRMYEVASHKLGSRAGNMTPGRTPVRLDGKSQEWIKETIDQMRDGTFQFKPGRRVLNPKRGSSNTRPLTIAPPRDKVVLEVMRMILEAIFETTFSDNSHGFRPKRNSHTALRQVKTQFGAVTTYIEGDISKCFDSFDHKILIDLVKRRVSDTRFIQLIWKALRAGYMEFHTSQHSIIDTLQGSIVSPLLANIYLHELDLYIEKLKTNYDKGGVASKNPEYRKLEYQRSKANKAGDSTLGKKYLKRMQQTNSRLTNDPKFRRIYYVRYAEYWFMAVRGPRSDSVDMLQSIRQMLGNSLKLDLSVEKSKIIHPRVEPALFLGTLISISNHNGYTRGNNHQKVKVASQIRMLAPMDRIFNKLTIGGFMSAKYKSGIPRFIWLANNKDSIIKLYNSVLSGYLDYYRFTHNYPRVASSLEFILKTSCAKLLAAKYKLGSVTKVIKRYGGDLKGKEKIGFLKPCYKLNVWEFKSKP